MAIVLEIDALVGSAVERPYTDDEVAQQDKDLADDAARQQAEADALAAREAALAKLAALGLTVDDLTALGL